MPQNAHPKRFPLEELLEVYRRHPLRERRILERLLSQRDALSGVDELALARDPRTGITDQNHVGGLRFVVQLAGRVGVRDSDHVLDLGCGLGGSARVLAHLYACRVHGVDLSHERCRDAESLTRLVGLQNLVSFECGDFLSMPVPVERYDVLWGQSTWAHVHDKGAFIQRWTPALKTKGSLAFEEVYLRARPTSVATLSRLSQLEECWKSHIVTRDEWVSSVPSLYRIDCLEDLSLGFVRNFARLIELAGKAGWDIHNSLEVAGWQHAHRLAAAGVLGYLRVVARKDG